MFDMDEVRSTRHQRQFKLAGEVFTTRRGIRQETLEDWEENAGATNREQFEATDNLICAFLIPEDKERFLALRARDDDDPLTGEDIANLAHWLITNETERPTRASSSSEPGDTSGAESSKDASSSEEETPVE